MFTQMYGVQSSLRLSSLPPALQGTLISGSPAVPETQSSQIQQLSVTAIHAVLPQL